MYDKNNAPLRFDISCLCTDNPCPADVAPASGESLDLAVDGAHLYGGLLLPDGSYPSPWPCAIFIHGYPGTSRNDDIAQVLRRCGMAVAVPHLRGAWGSQGTYTFAHIIEDTIALAESVRSGKLGRQLNADPSAIFLIGHSMGGWAALNAAKALPWLRGLCLLAPYELPWALNHGCPEVLRELLEEGTIMNTHGTGALFDEAVSMRDRTFAACAPSLSSINLGIAYGSRDTVAPPDMTEPLWNELKSSASRAIRRRKVFSADHSFNGCRIELSSFVSHFIKEALNSDVLI